ncbi:MAG TPA: 2-oxoacid:acceptor oxidoreductase subunit alpha [Bacillales bacterium]|nr:2-oxoacid:acceptor oxidoreductase subunit alpha [Bacillales bacterium]
MVNQFSWKVGGQQGEGIESTGEIFASALNRSGYYLYSYRHFSSRIKGGHTNNKIRVSTTQVRSMSDDLDLLVAFDQETIDVNVHELNEGGIVLADEKVKPHVPDDSGAQLYSIPFTKIATELGTSLMKNMVALGASAAALGLPPDFYDEIVAEIFGRKGQAVVEKNREAIRRGAEHFLKLGGNPFLELAKADGKKRMYMIGNDAIGLGALTAGVRFMAAYPITPASDIMEYLIKKLPEFGGTVIQTEDEIAACMMCIGSNYAGTRAFTASAGPGLSLMMESIGLAGMTETPLVVVDTQRGGPSTGLPTKQEHSDLLAMIHGTHGEIPKIVLAPSTVEEAFYDIAEAFNLADRYQCPVIFLSDLQLSLGKQTVEPLDLKRIKVDRGRLLKDGELSEQEDKQYFKRYETTEDGISPRVLPGTKNGIFHATGVEHDETGKPSENAENRIKQMNKRLRKLQNLSYPEAIYRNAKHQEADLLVVGISSSRGAIEEAIPLLEDDGWKVNHAHVRLVHPFPADEMKALMDTAKRIAVVENNATGQLASIIKTNVGQAEKIENVLKYDGTPFLPKELYGQFKTVLDKKAVTQ